MAGQCSAGTLPRVFHMLGALAATPIEVASAEMPPTASMAFSRGVMVRECVTHVCECTALTSVMQPPGVITPVNTFASRLKETREALGKSQAALAREIGVSPGAVGNWEAGGREAPRSLLALAKAIGVRAEWLRDGKGEKLPKPGEIELDLEAALTFLADQMRQADDLPAGVMKESFALLVDGRSEPEKVQKAIRLMSEAMGCPSGKESTPTRTTRSASGPS